MSETELTASTVFTDGIPLLDDYPAFDNHLKEAASWYQIGDLEKAGSYVRNIAENLHSTAGRGVRRTFLLQLVVHLVRTHPKVASSPRDRLRSAVVEGDGSWWTPDRAIRALGEYPGGGFATRSRATVELTFLVEDGILRKDKGVWVKVEDATETEAD